MTRQLDLADIQGNILQDFVSGYPTARFVFLRISDAQKGRKFILEYRAKVTTALRWATSGAYVAPINAKKPKVAINIAVTYEGFKALGLPTRTLARMPPEFMDGMKARGKILGDDEGKNLQSSWDPVWRGERAHIMIGLNALMDFSTGKAVPELETETNYLEQLCQKYEITILAGHGKETTLWQDASVLVMKLNEEYKPIPLEHFGFVDGISNPVFEGQFGDPQVEAVMAIGNGKILNVKPGKSPDDPGRWAPLATGEFLLGHPDEAQETPDTTYPSEIMRNGTFLVYRKLHENVASFTQFVDEAAKKYAASMNISVGEAREILKAKMTGRWTDGVPLAVAPTLIERKAFDEKYAGKGNDRPYVDFAYGDDPEGLKCPIGSHMRRTNTRDGLTGKSSALNNRRRILRRGIPYGETTPDDTGEHGIIFMAMCTSLSRQFEFVQQQWINYGLDAEAGNDTDPLVGNRAGDAKFVVPGDPEKNGSPFICSGMPLFVEMRGGDYFFLPSMTALRMIGMGSADPT